VKGIGFVVIPADALQMANQQGSVAAPEKRAVLVFRQARLNGHGNKILSIKTLNPVWIRQPPVIVPVKFCINNGALQQTFIYTIAESVIPGIYLSVQ